MSSLRNRCAIAFTLALGTLLTCPVTVTAGHYSLAWWRQKGAWENGAVGGQGDCLGGHVMLIWVFDEDGNPKPSVQLKTSWSVLLGTTDVDGRAEIPIDVNNTRYDMICVDGAGSTSDVALDMTSRLRPCWGHYSFEVGFMYKSNATNPGTFDTSLNCTLNNGCADYGTCPETTDAPFTKSLAYNSIDCTNYWSDSAALGTWQGPTSYFGQTFVATGNRVVAAKAQGTIGGNNILSFNAQILTWPGLQPVGPVSSTPVRFPFGWVLFWDIDDNPVVPGQTYLLKVWRGDTGMNAFHIASSVYPSGQYYEAGTAFSNRELMGFVCCATTAVVHITAGPQAVHLKSTQATITWTTDVASDSRVDYGLSTDYGNTQTNPTLSTAHSITLTGLVPATEYHYRVSSDAQGYTGADSGDLVFTTPPGVADQDRDNDVDQVDFGLFQTCFTGPGVEQTNPTCYRARLDDDVDVDQDDFAVFQNCLTGVGASAGAGCTE
ncbi:MAG: fibronectin type III domain-containing protein [Phycisphaerae bacterium]|nr:fibronectin type III domain-containing protein [Phycisphaerae bacterium]